MKKIKSYITNLPKGVKIIFLINLIVYLLTIVLDLFSIDLIKYFSVYSFLDSNFHIYQILTSIFTHSYNFDHILVNSIFILIFAPYVERKIKTKNFVYLYLMSGVISILTAEYFLCEKYIEYSKLINEVVISNSKFKDLEISGIQSNLSYNYLLGSSGAIFGILIYYFLSNFLNVNKIVYNIILLTLFVMSIIIVFTNFDESSRVSESAHLGGVINGLTYFIIFNFYSKIKN